MKTLYRRNANGMKTPQMKDCHVFAIVHTIIENGNLRVAIQAWESETAAKAGVPPNITRFFNIPTEPTWLISDTDDVILQEEAIQSDIGETVNFIGATDEGSIPYLP